MQGNTRVGAQVQADVRGAGDVQTLAHVEHGRDTRHLHAAQPLLGVLQTHHLWHEHAATDLHTLVAAGVGVGQRADARTGEVATAGALPSCLETHAKALTLEAQATVDTATRDEASDTFLGDRHRSGGTETQLAAETPAFVYVIDGCVDIARELFTSTLGLVELGVEPLLGRRDLLRRPGPVGLIRRRDLLLEARDLHAQLGLRGLELGIARDVGGQVGASTDDALSHPLEPGKLGLGRRHPRIETTDLGTVARRRGVRLVGDTAALGRREGGLGVEHGDGDQDGRDHEEGLHDAVAHGSLRCGR